MTETTFSATRGGTSHLDIKGVKAITLVVTGGAKRATLSVSGGASTTLSTKHAVSSLGSFLFASGDNFLYASSDDFLFNEAA